MKLLLLTRRLLCFGLLVATSMALHAQDVRYSTAWFGPNANPVPLFNGARIPAQTTFTLSADYNYGYGDRTSSFYATAELPLISKKVSFKVWGCLLESYSVDPQVKQSRGMIGAKNSGTATGDLYVQTRMMLYSNQQNDFNILLNATLRTASGSGFGQRRYFDTPGYYFDVEAGKSFFTGGKLVKEIRLGADLGFMAWETTGSWQDDAPMYGAKLILANDHWKLDNTLAGYYGWMHTSDRYGSDYGDAPLVLATRLEHTMGSRSLFIQYQHGLNDFPFNQFRIGYSFTAPRLTPRYRSL